LQIKDTENWIKNLALSVSLFIRFSQNDYARAVSLQLSQLLWMKETNHPVWFLFQQQPDVFLEVKGEWSLSKLTTILQKRNIRMNIEYAEQLYYLTKIIGDKKQYIYDDDTDFFGYDSVKIWKEDHAVVLQTKTNILSQIRKVMNNKSCIYPVTKICYGKKESVIRSKPNDSDLTMKFYRFKNDQFEVKIISIS
jgi:hypothetical protein